MASGVKFDFEDFLKIREFYKLKGVARMSSNEYFDLHSGYGVKRHETSAEHVYSCLKLADFFLSSFSEFESLDRVKIYEMLMYHDDCEIEVGDVCISKEELKVEVESEDELKGVKELSLKVPKVLSEKFVDLDLEFRGLESEEARFCKVIDKIDAMVHELDYPQDWGSSKGFGREDVIRYHRRFFEFSPVFVEVFDCLLGFLEENNFFDE